MPTANVTIQYVNPPKPGKKFGSIKTAELGYVGLAPEHLGKFSPGQTCKIEFTEQGDFKNFVRLVSSGATNGAQPQGRPQAGGSFSADQSRMIFITGVVGRAMGSGKFAPGDILDLTMEADAAWKELNNPSAKAPIPHPMDQDAREPPF